MGSPGTADQIVDMWPSSMKGLLSFGLSHIDFYTVTHVSKEELSSKK
jgi:hypothetical protein